MRDREESPLRTHMKGARPENGLKGIQKCRDMLARAEEIEGWNDSAKKDAGQYRHIL